MTFKVTFPSKILSKPLSNELLHASVLTRFHNTACCSMSEDVKATDKKNGILHSNRQNENTDHDALVVLECLHSQVHMFLDPSTKCWDRLICNLMFSNLPAICNIFEHSKQKLGKICRLKLEKIKHRMLCLQTLIQLTILHVRSSGPRGSAGLEYKKCLEYCIFVNNE